MSVYCIINQTMRLSDPTKVIRLNEPLAYSNARAHSFRVTVLAEDSDTPADLTGVGVVGQFMKQKVSETVSPILGTVTGNVCEVILPESCYVTPGRFRFTMDLSVSVPTTGVDAFSTSENYAIGDRVVYSGAVWVFTAAHSAGAWTGEDAKQEIESRTALWVEGFVEKNINGTIIDPGTPVGNISSAIANANAAASTANAAASTANTAAETANTAAASATAAAAAGVRTDINTQGLTDTQKSNARTNIGAIDASITGPSPNIFDMSVFDGVTGITKDENGYYVGTGATFANTFGSGIPGLSFDPGAQYFLSVVGYREGTPSSSDNGLYFKFDYTDGNSNRAYFKLDTSSPTKKTLQSTKEYSGVRATVSSLKIGNGNASSVVWHIKDIMLVKSAVEVPYYPHTTAVDSTARIGLWTETEIAIENVTYTNGRYINATGTTNTNNASAYTDPIAVKPGDIVTLSGVYLDSVRCLDGYYGTSTGNFVVVLAGNTTATTVTVVIPDGVYYIRTTMAADGTLTGKIVRRTPNFIVGSADVPVDNGTYVLKCTVSGGVPTFSWVADTSTRTLGLLMNEEQTEGEPGEEQREEPTEEEPEATEPEQTEEPTGEDSEEPTEPTEQPNER